MSPTHFEALEFDSLQFNWAIEEVLIDFAALAQASSSSATGPSFGAATFDFSAQQQLVFRPRGISGSL